MTQPCAFIVWPVYPAGHGPRWLPSLFLPFPLSTLSTLCAHLFSFLSFLSLFLCFLLVPHRAVLTLGGASLSGRTQAGGFGLGPGPSEVGSEFWRMTAPRALGVAVGVGTAGSGSWEAGKAARFRVGWSCRDWDRGTGAAYGFSGTRCATRLCRERPGGWAACSVAHPHLPVGVWAEKRHDLPPCQRTRGF